MAPVARPTKRGPERTLPVTLSTAPPLTSPLHHAPKKKPAVATRTLQSKLRDRRSIREAIVLAEVLGPPVSMRDEQA
jgi:hypothetical protein